MHLIVEKALPARPRKENLLPSLYRVLYLSVSYLLKSGGEAANLLGDKSISPATYCFIAMPQTHCLQASHDSFRFWILVTQFSVTCNLSCWKTWVLPMAFCRNAPKLRKGIWVSAGKLVTGYILCKNSTALQKPTLPNGPKQCQYVEWEAHISFP